LAPKPRLVCTFNGHGRMACFKTLLPRLDREAKSLLPGQPGQVSCIREDSVLFGPEALQKLLHDTHGVFKLLQTHKLGQNKNTDTSVDYAYGILEADPSALNLVHVSRAYR